MRLQEILHIEYVQFLVYQLYLNKTVLKENKNK